MNCNIRNGQYKTNVNVNMILNNNILLLLLLLLLKLC